MKPKKGDKAVVKHPTYTKRYQKKIVYADFKESSRRLEQKRIEMQNAKNPNKHHETLIAFIKAVNNATISLDILINFENTNLLTSQKNRLLVLNNQIKDILLKKILENHAENILALPKNKKNKLSMSDIIEKFNDLDLKFDPLYLRNFQIGDFCDEILFILRKKVNTIFRAKGEVEKLVEEGMSNDKLKKNKK